LPNYNNKIKLKKVISQILQKNLNLLIYNIAKFYKKIKKFGPA